MKTIVFCYTITETFNFSLNTIKNLKDLGYEVILISSEKDNLTKIAGSLGVQSRYLEISRSISVLADLKSVIRLIRILRNCKPDIVIGATPKGALISMIASYFVDVKCRIYHVFGLPYETAHGLLRVVLKSVEWTTSLFATEIIPISNSIYHEYLLNVQGVKNKTSYFYPLTVGGVDIERFNPIYFQESKIALRKELLIPKNNIVIGFAGRLTIDKGIYDFIDVIERLSDQFDHITALVVGSIDTRDSPDNKQLKKFFSKTNVIHIEWTTKIEEYFSVMDIFVLPSHREGFGNVNVEASAMEVPVISYNVTGCKDSVSENVSGLLVKSRDTIRLAEAIASLITDQHLRTQLGKNGRTFVAEKFSDKIVAQNFIGHILT